MKRKITICQDSGFCFGVNRAVEAVRSALSENCGERVCTLGPIVHNKKVVSELEALGAKSIDSHLEMSDGILIIRSHGVAPEILDEVTSKGLKVVDATCPFVKKIHKLVTEFKESEIPVIVIGKKEHPEVCGIVGYAGATQFKNSWSRRSDHKNIGRI